MKKSQQQTSASRNTATKPSDLVYTVINSSTLAPLWSAILQVLPAEQLPKKLPSMRSVVWASLPSLRQPMILTPDCVLLKLYWDVKSTPDQPFVSIVVHARGSFEPCPADTDTPEPSSAVYARSRKKWGKKDLIT